LGDSTVPGIRTDAKIQRVGRIYAADKKPQRISDEKWLSDKAKMQHSAQTVMNRAATLATQN
jgi:hypothetical protein